MNRPIFKSFFFGLFLVIAYFSVPMLMSFYNTFASSPALETFDVVQHEMIVDFLINPIGMTLEAVELLLLGMVLYYAVWSVMKRRK